MITLYTHAVVNNCLPTHNNTVLVCFRLSHPLPYLQCLYQLTTPLPSPIATPPTASGEQLSTVDHNKEKLMH